MIPAPVKIPAPVATDAVTFCSSEVPPELAIRTVVAVAAPNKMLVAIATAENFALSDRLLSFIAVFPWRQSLWQQYNILVLFRFEKFYEEKSIVGGRDYSGSQVSEIPGLALPNCQLPFSQLPHFPVVSIYKL